MSARQFAFITSRLLAAFLIYVSIQNLFYFTLTIGSASSGSTSGGGLLPGTIRLIAWAITPVIGLVLWNTADRFTEFLLTDAPSDSTGTNRSPWEQSALGLIGVVILIRLLPTLVSYFVAYVQWENTPPADRQFEMFFGQYLEFPQIAARASELTLGLILLFASGSAWRGMQSLQGKSLSQAVKDLRELGVTKDSSSDVES